VDSPAGGVLVPVGDALATADAVDWLLRNPGARHELSQSARISAERFRWDRLAQQHFAFLESIHASRPQREERD
jgi:glycosyltransferase involved in cell wall biosynthesis